jgi:lipoprotein-anchoring transpeptidase ErfK/SrfK
MRTFFVTTLFVVLAGIAGFLIYQRLSPATNAAGGPAGPVAEGASSSPAPSRSDAPVSAPNAAASKPALSIVDRAILETASAASKGDLEGQAAALTRGIESVFSTGGKEAWNTAAPLLEALRALNEKLWYQPAGDFRSTQEAPAPLSRITGALAKKTPPVRVGMGLIAKMNRIADIHVVPGHRKLRVPTESQSIRVFTKSYALIVYLGPFALDAFPIGIGKPSSPTPAGEYEIVEILQLDQFDKKATRWVRPDDGKELYYGDPEYPFGSRFLRFGAPVDHYGIHGTDRDDAIGNAISHGCVRMLNNDVRALAQMLDAGRSPRYRVTIE